MVFCIEKRNTCSLQTVVYFELFWSFLQSTSYILVTAPSRAPALSWLLRLVRRRDFGDQQPALSTCSKRFSDSSNVKATDRIPSTTCLEYQFWQFVFSCRDSLESKLSIPDFVLHCLEMEMEISPSSARQNPGRKAWVGGYWRWFHAYTHT